MENREVISIHIGGAGVQIGSACWELYCLEHGMAANGEPQAWVAGQNISNFFSGSETGKKTPRAVFVDMEPTIIDEIRTGTYRQLFRPEQMITGKEDAANNYARGHYNRRIIDDVSIELRKLIEECNAFQGFLIYHGVGGGTGSGLSTRLAQELATFYPRKIKHCFSVYPGPQLQTSILEPYNCLLSTASLLENCDVQHIFDNEALFNICQSRLDVEQPTVLSTNPLIAQVSSSLTQADRYDGLLGLDNINLISIMPQFHTLVPALAPLVNPAEVAQTPLDMQSITDECFVAGNQMLTCNPSEGKFMAASLLYRGVTQVADVVKSNTQARYGDRFFDWATPTFHSEVIMNRPVITSGSHLAQVDLKACMLSNTTAVAEAWARLSRKFDLMYAKRAFVHWYEGEGMTEFDFTLAREEMAKLEREFKELTSE